MQIINTALTVLLLSLVSGQSQNTETLKGHKLYKCSIDSVEQATKLNQVADVLKTNSAEKYAVVRSRNEIDDAIINAITKCVVAVEDLSQPKFSIQDTARSAPSLAQDGPEGNSRLAASPSLENVNPFFADYQSHDAIREKLIEWSKKYSHLADFTPTIGKTIEGRDIYSFKISRKACTKSSRKSIWFNGGIHAREWISPATVMYIIDQLLSSYSTNSEVRAIFNKFDLYFTPVSNPDGYEYTRDVKGDRLWRKNRRQNADGTFGVDLNRNFDERWAVIGSSDNTTSEVYHGTSAHSEPETQALIKFGLNLPRGYAGIDFHSYGQLILRSWGFVIAPSNNEAYLKPLGDGMAEVYAKHGYNYTSDLSAGLYPAGGAVDDWMAARAKLLAYTLELCPTDDETNFVLPKEQIVPCASATYDATLFFFKFLSKNYNIPPPQPLP